MMAVNSKAEYVKAWFTLIHPTEIKITIFTCHKKKLPVNIRNSNNLQIFKVQCKIGSNLFD